MNRPMMLSVLLATVWGCSDPLKEGIVASLGPEDAGFGTNEIHRPGQPCVACHSTYEGAKPIMSIGGTLFTDPILEGDLKLVPEHTIRLIDSEGTIVEKISNRCGNFFTTLDEFDPAYPVRAELYGPGADDSLVSIVVMASRIGRDGSCGSCHAHPATSQSPGVVYVPDGRLSPDVDLPDAADCPPPRFAPDLFNPTPQ